MFKVFTETYLTLIGVNSLCSTPAKACPNVLSSDSHLFNFLPFTVGEVHKALKSLDTGKAQGPDLIDPYFLKMAADFIAEPLSHIFNLTVENKEIPKMWKSALVLPLLKGGDPTILNNYWPILKLSFLRSLRA